MGELSPSITTARSVSGATHLLSMAILMVSIVALEAVNGFPTDWITAGFRTAGDGIAKGGGTLQSVAVMIMFDAAPLALAYCIIWPLAGVAVTFANIVMARGNSRTAK